MGDTIQGAIQINTENIENEDEVMDELYEQKHKEHEEKRLQAEKEEEKRLQAEKEEEEKRLQAEKEEEEKRLQAEKEEEEKKYRSYDENYNGEKTLFLQMPMVNLFSKTYKLLYIPYTFKTDEPKSEYANNETITDIDNDKSSKSNWFGFLRNDKLKQIDVYNNSIIDYTDSTITDEMKLYKSFVVNSLYARLIFTVNESKEISLYDLFFYYTIDVKMQSDDVEESNEQDVQQEEEKDAESESTDVKSKPRDVKTIMDDYKLNNLSLYEEDLKILNKNNSELDIYELLTEESNTEESNPEEPNESTNEPKTVYYVYIYDIINNKMILEFNVKTIHELHNIVNTQQKNGGKSTPNKKTPNKKKNIKTIRKIKSTKKTLKNNRKQ
jgi:hypothetical protein